MSEPASSSEIPENIGRNDPCPCGSGQKYKKCCQRSHRLQKESEKKSNEPHRLIGSASLPLRVYKVLSQVHANNAVGLFYELCHDQGPLRTRFADKSAFVEAIDSGDTFLPAAKDFEFLHIRLDEPHTYLVLRYDDPKLSSTQFQVITLRRNEVDADGTEREAEHKGFRVWDILFQEFPRDEYEGVPPLSAFGIDWRSVS